MLSKSDSVIFHILYNDWYTSEYVCTVTQSNSNVKQQMYGYNYSGAKYQIGWLPTWPTHLVLSNSYTVNNTWQLHAFFSISITYVKNRLRNMLILKFSNSISRYYILPLPLNRCLKCFFWSKLSFKMCQKFIWKLFCGFSFFQRHKSEPMYAYKRYVCK